MTITTSAAEGLWLDTASPSEYPELRGRLDVDVAVIGGGIAGLTTALLVAREGARVAVVEAARIGTGVTGCTTAKVSALQATIYSTIASRHGSEAASRYAQASRAGVERVAELAATEGIECDLVRRDAFTYAADESERSSVEEEFEAARRAGLNAEFTDDARPALSRLRRGPAAGPGRPAPGPLRAGPGRGPSARLRSGVRAGAGARGQRRFPLPGAHSRRRAHGQARRGGHALSDSRPGPVLRPAQGGALLLHRRPAGGRQCPSGNVDQRRKQHALDPLLWRVSDRGRRGPLGGLGRVHAERFERLAEFARRHWDVAETTHRWSAHDPVPYDHLPMIGPYRPGSSRLWVTTGFMKWGLASATFGA